MFYNRAVGETEKKKSCIDVTGQLGLTKRMTNSCKGSPIFELTQ